MNGLWVRILLDTGPTSAEIDEITGLFATVGMTVTIEGHSYGGPPPTSAFLIVVNAPLAPMLDRFALDPDAGPPAFEHLVGRLQKLRADRRRWGRPHTVRLEDATNGLDVSLPAGTPSEAYAALLDLDLSRIDRNSPAMRITWHDSLRRWTAERLDAPRAIAHRLHQRDDDGSQPTVRQGGPGQVAELWRLVGHAGDSAVTWQRASVVLWSVLGFSVSSIAGRTMMRPDRIGAVIRNFNRHGFASLAPGYPDGEPVQPSPAEHHDAWWIARRSPAEFGLPGAAWAPASLAEFLVGTGVAEDVDPKWLQDLLTVDRRRV